MEIITRSFAQTALRDDILVQQGHAGLWLRERPRHTSAQLHRHTLVAALHQMAETGLAEELSAVALQGIDVMLQSVLRKWVR